MQFPVQIWKDTDIERINHMSRNNINYLVLVPDEM